MAELADALRSGRSELYAHVGSTPTFGIQSPRWGFLFLTILRSGVPSGKMASMSENGEGRNRLSSIWLIAFVIVGILILGDLNRRMANARRLERDAVQLETEVAVMATDRVQLMTSVAEATSEAIIAEWAHSDAKLVREGETLIVPLPPPGQITLAIPTPGQNIETPNNWQVWWALIFGY